MRPFGIILLAALTIVSPAAAQRQVTLRDTIGVWRTTEDRQWCFGEYVFRLDQSGVSVQTRGSAAEDALSIAYGLNPDRPLSIPIRYREGTPHENANSWFAFRANDDGSMTMRHVDFPPCVMWRQ